MSITPEDWKTEEQGFQDLLQKQLNIKGREKGKNQAQILHFYQIAAGIVLRLAQTYPMSLYFSCSVMVAHQW